MSGPPDDERDYPSNRATITALPSFRPIRDDSESSPKADSSASGSRRSGSHSPFAFDRKAPGRTSDGSAYSEKSLEQTNDIIKKRGTQRGSGGFLLDQTFPASRLSRTLLSRSHKSQKDVKGKRKSDGHDLTIPKRRVGEARQAHRSSIGSSPLTTEVTAAVDQDETARNGSFTPAEDAQLSELSRTSSNQINYTHGWTPDSMRSARPSVGFATDPAQIVSMALTLSEARRRQASGVRAVSGGQIGGSRATPGSTPQPGSDTVRIGSIGHFLTPQRQGSRNISPRPNVISPKLNGASTASSRGFLSPRNGLNEDEMEQETLVSLTPATVKRIQKAKNYFELAYEHRRLLSHLPPLRTPRGNSNPREQTKIYNPLQYVRNRKLRFREKAPIRAEEEGWHDIFQVRTWVDAVIASHNDTRYDPDECVRLPDLAQHKNVSANDEKDAMDLEDADAGGRQANGNQAPKPKRPRSDWQTHPGDFIADAYWLEQGLNKTKIEDGDGNPLYPSNTHFKFSGWRNRMPVQVPSDLQEHIPPPEPPPEHHGRRNAPSALPELPTFRSAQLHEKKPRKDRGRVSKIRDSIANPKDDSDSRRRSARIFGNLDYSSGSATASDSEAEAELRGRKRTSRKLHMKFSGRDSSSRNRPGQNTGDQPSTSTYSGDGSQSQSGLTSKRGSLDSGRISRLFTKDSMKAHSQFRPSHSRSDSTRRDSAKPRVSQDSDRVPRSSAEYDTTVPNSPTGPEFPSIAINLSPPPSRSPSPTKKVLSSLLNPFRDRSKQRQGISTTDFAHVKPARDPSTESDESGGSNPVSRGPSPMSRGISPTTRAGRADAAANETPLPASDNRSDHRDSTVSRVSTKSAAPSVEGQSKVRGIFKGGRIAELVGNEVSRVGDFIWKREPPGTYRPRMSASTASVNSHDDSDSDGEHWSNGNVFKTPPPHKHKRVDSHDSFKSDRSSPTALKSSPSSADKPQYNNPNLPSFTSPFARDKETQEEKKRTHLSPTDSGDDQDHIARLAAQHRSASRSPRMDRLAPPKLNTSRPGTPPGIIVTGDRRDSYGFGSQLDISGSRRASQIFNDAVNDKPEGFPPTGLTGLKPSRSGINLTRDWNASNQSLIPAESTTITRQDIARATAMLMSSAVKAREICLRADSPRSPMPKFLLDTIDPSNEALHSPAPLKVRRREEHIVAARNLISKLSSQASQFQEQLHHFSAMTTPYLHTELQTLEDVVDRQMTPQVRSAADQAGELSMKLTTTSTLALKALNDSIGSAMRRRRKGPVRFLRRFGYKMIEVGVVALLWGIWLVVTLLHAALTTVTGSWRVVKWLLWLD